MIPRSKGYEALRYYVRYAFWLTHRDIIVRDRENIPKGKPIIFAANHQNALMDPLALVCTNPLQTLWLARADIFRSKAARPFLKFLKMIPIYRIRDGKDNLSNNEEIFNQVSHVLEENGSVALFPEAAHSGKRQMLPHKKAIPRIALESEEKNNFSLGLKIVPVGIYYDHYSKFNRSLIVNYGEPIEVDAYKDRYHENPQNAMLQLRDEIHDKLEPLTMQINSSQFYSDYENIRMIAGKELAGKKLFSEDSDEQLYLAEKEVIARMEKLEATKPDDFERIRKGTGEYVNELKRAGVTDNQLVKASGSSFFKLLFQLMFAVLTFPFFAFGFLFNALPYFLIRAVLAGKVKDPAFLSTFVFAIGLILFPIFYLLEGGILIAVYSLRTALILFLVMPFAGKQAFELFLFYQDLANVLKLKLFKKKQFRNCKKFRTELIKAMKF